MRSIKWLKRGLHDMDRIALYIARDNKDRAISFVHEIFDQVDNLRWFPYLGRSGAKENMRELVIQKHYLVSYRIKEDTIEILQVWHTAKDR
ncbi:MAG: type II toxin-antitoxin system RelE/ParE family toxin [Candidatus Moraniibacteriota bacterium]